MPAGARRRRGGRRAVRDGPPVVLTGGRAHRRARCIATDAGRRVDVPVQQPRRVARAAAHGRRVRAHPRARARQHALARVRVLARRVRIPREDAAGADRVARVRARVSLRGPAAVRPPHLAARSSAGSRCSCRRVGGSRSCSSRRRRAVRTSAARRPTASGTSCSVTTVSAGSPGTRPAASAAPAAGTARSGARPG